MDTNQVVSAMSSLIRQAIDIAGESEVKLGNVSFWFDGDSLCCSLPVFAWNSDAISAELAAILSRPKPDQP